MWEPSRPPPPYCLLTQTELAAHIWVRCRKLVRDVEAAQPQQLVVRDNGAGRFDFDRHEVDLAIQPDRFRKLPLPDQRLAACQDDRMGRVGIEVLLAHRFGQLKRRVDLIHLEVWVVVLPGELAIAPGAVEGTSPCANEQRRSTKIRSFTLWSAVDFANLNHKGTLGLSSGGGVGGGGGVRNTACCRDDNSSTWRAFTFGP